MISQMLIAFGALLLAGSLHFFGLRTAARLVRKMEVGAFPSFLVILLAGTVGQCLAALIFAFGYALSIKAGLGNFDPASSVGLMEIYSFSLVNLTTLGLGDVVPEGHLKLLAGVEAMTGFLLISCTASHIFQIMKADLLNND